MGDLRSIGDRIAHDGLPPSLAAFQQTYAIPQDQMTPPSTTPSPKARTRRSWSNSTASLIASDGGPNRLSAKLASIKAMRDAERAQRIAERRARWEADSADWQGECATCLDTGCDYLTELDCDCPAGVARAEERDRRRAARRAEAIDEQITAVLGAARIPPEYAGWTLDNFPRRSQSLLRLRGWASDWDGREGLILFGNYGVGKTSLMIGLLRSLALRYLSQRDSDARIRARFTRASQFLADLRAAMDSEDGAYNYLMTAAKQVRLFVLDDLGRENPRSDWVSETLFEIIDARYAHGLPILATTNYTPETLTARLGANGEAIMERINDRCVWMRINGASMRKAQARVIE